MAADPHWAKLERMFGSAPINRFFQPTMQVTDGEATISMEVGEAHFHAAGTAHGCVAFKMLDDAGFFAAQSTVRDRFIVTASFQTYLLRPITSGTLEAYGRLVHTSRRLLVAEAEVRQGDQVVARGSGTYMTGAVGLEDAAGYA